jgi:hypothetical protein
MVMKINLDRLCKLAGVESPSEVLSEASNRSMHDDPSVADEVDHRYGGVAQLSEGGMDPDEEPKEGAMDDLPPMAEKEDHDKDEGAYHEGSYMEDMQEMEGSYMEEMIASMDEEDHDKDKAEAAYMEEMIEVDEAMLVQEIRRARQMLATAQKGGNNPETIQEAQLRRIVAEEVDSLMKDLNLTSGWVYGSNKPTNSKRGTVNTAFPGIGFKK